jgi:hypothetical protein
MFSVKQQEYLKEARQRIQDALAKRKIIFIAEPVWLDEELLAIGKLYYSMEKQEELE